MSIHSKYSNLDEKHTSLNVSIEEDDFLEPWENLIQYLSSTHIEGLHKIFKNNFGSQSSEITPVQLSKDEFVKAIDSVLGNSKYSMQAISLYNEIPYPVEEKITWIQFINYYIDHAITKESTDIQLSEPEIFGVPHIKRETIMKIVLLESNTWFCYAIISKYGKVGLYTGNFELLTTYNVVFTRTDTDANDKYRPRKSVWVTDAVFLANVQILAVCTAARSISFYDASGQKHMPLWLIEGIPNTVECMTYYHDIKYSKLFLGTDDGCVITMNFNKPKEDLLRKKHSDKLNKFFWRELADDTAYVTIRTYKKIHSSMIRCIKYYPEYYTFVSCSRDSKNSVVFYNMKERKKNYIFKIAQGANCFDLNYDLHILITGNDNGVVQIWNIFVCAKAIAHLAGHKKSIVDLKILASRKIAITCSSDGVLKTWNLKTFACEQTLILNYPSFGVLGKSIEWGTSPIYPGPKSSGEDVETNKKVDAVDSDGSSRLTDQKKLTKNQIDYWKRSTLLISCCNHIAKMKVVCKSNDDSVEHEILPPPPMQNKIMIPNHWRIGHPSFLDIESEETLVRPKPNKVIRKMVKELMAMDFLKDQKLHDKNTKLAALEAKKSGLMKKCVEQCAPFLALDLYELEEIKLSPNLPVPNFRSTQKLADRTQRLLSAASTRSGILSDLSRSSRSSRSSVIEF